MKTIDIITLSCARNYGAMLQTYALYKYLDNAGYDVKIIDYITERYNLDDPNYVNRAIKGHRIFDKNALTRLIWKLTYYKQEKQARNLFRGFLEKNVKLTKKYYNNNEIIDEKADVYITGSDQIWNSDFSWDKKIDTPYFLGFVNDNSNKISYSSSFGKSILNDSEIEDIKHYLSKFNYLGVREQSGKEIIELLGLEADVVADPTLLLSESEWSRIASNRIVSEPYLLLFQITPNKDFIRFAKRLAKDNRLKLIILCPDSMHRLKVHSNGVFLPKVEDWISYFQYADFIMTDSFHATAFSTIFQKDFLVGMFAGYNTRISSLLKIIGLEDRAITSDDLFEINCKLTPVDYSKSNSLRNKFVEQSKEWLLNAIESTKNE